MIPQFINIAAYKFVELDDLARRKSELIPFCKSLNLKGTILLSQEGINLFLAGTRSNIDEFVGHLRRQPEFNDIPIKESVSDHQPFNRMLVRLKKEIISMGVEAIRPTVQTSPKISPQTLKTWLDEGKELTLLDVRNDYEIEVGSFANAVPIGVDHFRCFPEATEQLPADMKERPLVMFCTGGIRCEKAGPLMEQGGFRHVYQLDGGILKYFEDCGGDHYEGDCFVFDKRVAVSPDLEETDAALCFACQSVLTREDQQSETYHPPDHCPKCFQTAEQKQQEILQNRESLIALQTTPLPGSIPYDNVRPMNVPLRLDGQPLIEFLLGMHAKLERKYWLDECANGRIEFKGKPLSAGEFVQAGWRIEHLIPHTTEPPVNNRIEFLYEDENMIAINKPAPLPMHPCGQYNRNTLDSFVNRVYPEERIRILHRLDANTTGVVVMARTKAVARLIHPQFLEGTVKKTYLARVMGHPRQDEWVCTDAISPDASTAGSRTIDSAGQTAVTEFRVLERFDDETSLIECRPQTGRTNQIRLHLSHAGFPIGGDPTYGHDQGTSDRQSLGVQDPPMCLHAWKLELIHPVTGEPLRFTANKPHWCDARFFEKSR